MESNVRELLGINTCGSEGQRERLVNPNKGIRLLQGVLWRWGGLRWSKGLGIHLYPT